MPKRVPQLELFATRDPGVPRTAPIAERFRAFHGANPHVYRALRNLALEARRRGRQRYGMKGLFEVLRWHYALETTDVEFKLNNNFTAHYARMLMAREPEPQGFFETREHSRVEAA